MLCNGRDANLRDGKLLSVGDKWRELLLLVHLALVDSVGAARHDEFDVGDTE